MIAYVNPLQSREFVELCSVEPIIGARICSWFCCYANAYPFCDMWILYSSRRCRDRFAPYRRGEEGWPHGVAARYQGTLCIACDDEVDFDELMNRNGVYREREAEVRQSHKCRIEKLGEELIK